MKKNIIGLIGHDSANITLNIARSLKKFREDCRIIDASSRKEFLKLVNPEDSRDIVDTEYFGIPVVSKYTAAKNEDCISLVYFGMDTDNELMDKIEYIVCETDMMPTHIKALRTKKLISWAEDGAGIDHEEDNERESEIKEESVFKPDDDDEEEADVFPEFVKHFQTINPEFNATAESEPDPEPEEVKPAKMHYKRKPVKSDRFTLIIDDYISCRFDKKYIFQILGITPQRDKCYKIALNKRDTARRIYLESTLYTSGQVAMSDTYKSAFLFTLQNILGRKLKHNEIAKVTK